MRKCNDEVYQLAKDQALVKKLKKTKDLGLFVYAFGCNVYNSRIQKLSLFCLWFSFQLGLWIYITCLKVLQDSLLY